MRSKDMANNINKIPKAVVKRLSLYSRVLQNLEIKNIHKVSSKDLGDLLGVNSAQVRKDLAYFGQFGVPGFGYYVSELRTKIKEILGTNRPLRIGLVGVGNLGTALLSYTGFEKQDTVNLERKIRENQIEIIILTVPSETAQEITNRIVKAGVSAILNFVPTRLIVPDYVTVHYVDLSIEIESLSFYLK
jgi:redox-sensing transcriptional repressor